ncbi:hypothetical protein DFQ28_002861 [Apophysomyces sp. BC1034]|nr:hypothetical protein DFQ28_002861 [Apophysomyces sp. BC1034]
MSLEDVLAARTALENATKSYQPTESSLSPTSPNAGNQNDRLEFKEGGENEFEPSLEDEKDESRQQPSSSTVSSVGHEESVEITKEPEEREYGNETSNIKPIKPRRTQSARRKTDEVNNVDQQPTNGRPAKRPRNATSTRRTNSTGSRRGQTTKPRSRTSTPQPSESNQPCVDICSTIFDNFSKAARESSPPARIRYPSARMSISEMNRRAKQILEYISSVQVEMASKDGDKDESVKIHSVPETILDQMNGKHYHVAEMISPLTVNATKSETTDVDMVDGSVMNGVEELKKKEIVANGIVSEVGAGAESKKQSRRPDPIQIPQCNDHHSPSSSLSSASTIPLDPASPRCDPLETEPGVAEETIERMKTDELHQGKPMNEQTSLDIMDMLTRELIKFQRRFGTGSYSLHGHRRARSRDVSMNEETMSESHEGETLRRDTSSNDSSFQSLSEKHTAHVL